MTEEDRVHYLLKYHENLTNQFVSSLEETRRSIGRQLRDVEEEIESILFSGNGDENES